MIRSITQAIIIASTVIWLEIRLFDHHNMAQQGHIISVDLLTKGLAFATLCREQVK